MQNDPYFSRYAHGLGYGGLLPLALLIGVVWFEPHWTSIAVRLGIVYTGTILAFLGGIQWGFALRSSVPKVRLRRFAVGVLPSLWVTGTLMMPVDLCVPLLVFGLVVLLVYEWLEQREAEVPAWYLPLRLQLTAGLSLELGLLYLITAIGG